MKIRVESETNPDTCRLLKAEWELHHRKAERSYQQLKEDSALAKSNPDVDTITFDLQQSLPTPVLTTSIVFYKRQLWTYNLGIHCCKTETGYMHMWHEGEASRGSKEVGSCVLTYLKDHPTNASHLIMYSDSCGGQNRNINAICLWLNVVNNDNYSYTTIDHKFMVSGHSYLPNDWDFGGIELARRRASSLFVPDDWCVLVENARRKNGFQVRKMHQTDFVTSSSLKAMIVNRKVNTKGDKVDWFSIHWIRVEKASPFSFKYRYTLNTLEQWKTVNIRPKRKGRPSDIGRANLPPLYTAPRPIKAAKLKDLKDLLCYVPPIHHAFYNLAACDEAEEDGDEEAEGYEEDED